MIKSYLTLVLTTLLFVPELFAQGLTNKIPATSIPFDSVAFSQIKKNLAALSVIDFQKRAYFQGDLTLPYRLLSPLHPSGNKKYPLVITLHNSSRMGNDNEKQLEALSRIWLLPSNRKKFKAYVVAPQFAERSANYTFDSTRKILVAKPSETLKSILSLIEQLKKELNIDSNRVYLIGYSMGGSAAQNLMNLRPDLFTAMVSIAGVPDFSNLEGIKEKPIWLIHGKNDVENPFEGSEVLYKELKNIGKVRFTAYENLDHGTINYPLLFSREVIDWLLRN